MYLTNIAKLKMGFRIKNNAIKCYKNLIQFVDMMLKHKWKKQCETPCKMKKNLDKGN